MQINGNLQTDITSHNHMYIAEEMCLWIIMKNGILLKHIIGSSNSSPPHYSCFQPKRNPMAVPMECRKGSYPPPE